MTSASQGDLTGVLAVARPLADLPGVRLFVTSLEFWSDGFLLIVAGRHEPGSVVRDVGGHLVNLMIHITDDRGRGYRAVAGSAGGTGMEMRMLRWFAPAVPSDASALRLTFPGTTNPEVQVPLTGGQTSFV